MLPRKAVETAASMSLISMLAMETAMTLTERFMTNNCFAPERPEWWASVGVSLAAGFLAPLPYNVQQLHKYGRSPCCGSRGEGVRSPS